MLGTLRKDGRFWQYTLGPDDNPLAKGYRYPNAFATKNIMVAVANGLGYTQDTRYKPWATSDTTIAIVFRRKGTIPVIPLGTKGRPHNV